MVRRLVPDHHRHLPLFSTLKRPCLAHRVEAHVPRHALVERRVVHVVWIDRVETSEVVEPQLLGVVQVDVCEIVLTRGPVGTRGIARHIDALWAEYFDASRDGRTMLTTGLCWRRGWWRVLCHSGGASGGAEGTGRWADVCGRSVNCVAGDGLGLVRP